MAYLEELLPEFRKGYILGEIKGNKFHFVTPDGRVLSFAKDKPVWRKPTPDKDGYLCIGIKISGKTQQEKYIGLLLRHLYLILKINLR